MSKYQVGNVISGTVTGIKPYGAFVNVDGEYTGLVHISEISDGFVRNIEDFMRIDEKIELKILEIDPVLKHMKLSLKSIADTKRTNRRYMQFSKEYRRDVAIFKQDFEDIYAVVDEELTSKDALPVVALDFQYYPDFDSSQYQERVALIHADLHNQEKAAQESFGWVEQPMRMTKEEINRIITCGQTIRNQHNTLVICGIGGSYLGAKAGIDMLNSFKKDNKMDVVYVGHTLSSQYTNYLLDYLKGRDFVVNVISKSGGTMESAIAFRLIRNLLNQKYGEEQAKNRIYVTTDPQNGLLKKAALEKGYTTFDIPPDIGGRYSVLTSVGLLPFVVAGIDVEEMIRGAQKAYQDLLSPSIQENTAYQYATARLLQQERGKVVELLVTYEPQLLAFAEWWKQLFAESEGKNQKGIFPAAVNFTTDLHSLGQFIQEGTPLLFETVLELTPNAKEVIIHELSDDFDQLNSLKNHTLTSMNQMVLQATLEAHSQTANVPNILIRVHRYDAFGLGYLFYFFMKSAAMSSYLQGVNPFNQPGVEVYKKNVALLLGKKAT